MQEEFENKLKDAHDRAQKHDAYIRDKMGQCDSKYQPPHRLRLRRMRTDFDQNSRVALKIETHHPERYAEDEHVKIELFGGRCVSGTVTKREWLSTNHGTVCLSPSDPGSFQNFQINALDIEARVKVIQAMDEEFDTCMNLVKATDTIHSDSIHPKLYNLRPLKKGNPNKFQHILYTRQPEVVGSKAQHCSKRCKRKVHTFTSLPSNLIQTSSSDSDSPDLQEAHRRVLWARHRVNDALLFRDLSERFREFDDFLSVTLNLPGRAFLHFLNFQASKITFWLKKKVEARYIFRYKTAVIVQKHVRGFIARRHVENQSHELTEAFKRSRVQSAMQVFEAWRNIVAQKKGVRAFQQGKRLRLLAKSFRKFYSVCFTVKNRRRQGLKILACIILKPIFEDWQRIAHLQARIRQARYSGKRLMLRLRMSQWIFYTIQSLAERQVQRHLMANEIQRVWRGFQSRQYVKCKRDLIVRLQALNRGRRCRKEFIRFNGLRDRLTRHHQRRKKRMKKFARSEK